MQESSNSIFGASTVTGRGLPICFLSQPGVEVGAIPLLSGMLESDQEPASWENGLLEVHSIGVFFEEKGNFQIKDETICIKSMLCLAFGATVGEISH